MPEKIIHAHSGSPTADDILFSDSELQREAIRLKSRRCRKLAFFQKSESPFVFVMRLKTGVSYGAPASLPIRANLT